MRMQRKKAHVMEETGYPVEKLKKIQLNENLRDKDAGKSQDDRGDRHNSCIESDVGR